MTNLHEGMSPEMRIELEPATIRVSGRRASDLATAPCSNLVLHFVLCSVYNDCRRNQNDQKEGFGFSDKKKLLRLLINQAYACTQAYTM